MQTNMCNFIDLRNMHRATWGLVIVVVLVAGGGLVAATADDLWIQFRSTDSANDLTIENELSERVAVAVTVREDGATVATANASVNPGEQTEIEDLAPHGKYRLMAEQGNRTLRFPWGATGCAHSTIEVTSGGLERSVIVC